MKKLLSWVTAALVGVVLAPLVALALYNPDPTSAERGGWGMLDEIAGKVRLHLSPEGHIEKLGSSRAVVGELDTKALTLYIADIGTAGSHHLVIPTTGTIITAWAVPSATSANAGATALTMYSTSITGKAFGSNERHQDAIVTAFSISVPSAMTAGVKATDEVIGQRVGEGDVIAIMTDGGATLTVPTTITVLIRME